MKSALIFALVVACALYVEAAPRCPDGWTMSITYSKCYKLADDCGTTSTSGSCTMSDARDACKAEKKRKNSKLVTPNFANGEAAWLLTQDSLLPNVENDNNKVWVGAVRMVSDSSNTDWRYQGNDGPDFQDGTLGSRGSGLWGPNQPDDSDTNVVNDCQCGMMMARYNTWSERKYDDRHRDATARALCEIDILGV